MRMWRTQAARALRRAAPQQTGWALTLLLVGWCLLAAWGGAPMKASVATVHAAGGPTLTIVQPQPSNSSVTGPVGANIVVAADHLLPTDTYTLGYAINDIGCQAGFTDLASSPVTATADASGAFTIQVAWPASAGNVGSSYVLCARDQTTPAIVAIPSQDRFVVAASAAPAITASAANGSSSPPNAADTTATPTAGASFAPGSPVQVNGTNFVGSTSSLTAYLSLSQAQTAADLQRNATPLVTGSGDQHFRAQSGGTFQVTLKLPSIQVANAYLYVVSTDGNTQYLPTLVATQQVSLNPASAVPSPTASPSPSPSATAHATASTTTRGGSGSDTPPSTGNTSSGRLPLILGLAVASGILFILGLVLIATGAAGSR